MAENPGQDVADEIEAPFRKAYNFAQKYLGAGKTAQDTPNATVQKLNAESDAAWRKHVADSFYKQDEKKPVRKKMPRKR